MSTDTGLTLVVVIALQWRREGTCRVDTDLPGDNCKTAWVSPPRLDNDTTGEYLTAQEKK